MRKRTLWKKRMVSAAMAAMLVISLSACGSAEENTEQDSADQSGTEGKSEFEGQTLVLGVWGGTWREAFDEACVKPFEEQYGVTIEEEEMGDNIVAQVIAQVEQDIEGIDVTCGNGTADFCQYLGLQGAVKELDYSKLPNSETIGEEAKTDYGVGMYIAAESFAYDNEAFPETPEGAKGFFDVEKYPGDRSIRGFAGSGVLEQALLADGVAFEDMYPLDLDRAFAKLDTIKPYLTKYWSSGAEIVQTLNDKEAVAGEYWFSHVDRAIDEGADVTMTYQDTAKFADAFCIVSNSEKDDLAYEFINFCLDEKVQAELCTLNMYAPINESALQYMDEERAEELACFYLPYEEGGTFWVQTEYWGENYEEISERYQLWMAE